MIDRRFTERVRRVMHFAREEAGRLQHDYIGTEHLLLGLLREGEGVAAVVLTNMGLDIGGERQSGTEQYARADANPELFKIEVGRQVAEITRVPRTGGDCTRCRELYCNADGHAYGAAEVASAKSWSCSLPARRPRRSRCLNPAVTFGLVVVVGRFKSSDAGPYILAQVIGAVAAAALLYVIASGKPTTARDGHRRRRRSTRA